MVGGPGILSSPRRGQVLVRLAEVSISKMKRRKMLKVLRRRNQMIWRRRRREQEAARQEAAAERTSALQTKICLRSSGMRRM